MTCCWKDDMRQRKACYENVTITVHFPEYFKEFSCIGGECGDTCCGCWNISADEKTLKRYGEVTGIFGQRLKASIDKKTGSFIQTNGSCPFFNDEKLCELYIHLGKESLCKTCRRYPRHVEVYGSLHEVSLSLSCPEAAGIILGGDRMDRLYVRRRMRGSRTEQIDERFLAELLDIREGMLKVMENRFVSIEMRMAMVLALGHDVERRIGDPEAVKEIVKRYTAPRSEDKFERQFEKHLKKNPYKQLETAAKQMEERRNIMCVYLEFLGGMEPVVKGWGRQMEHYAKLLYHPEVKTETYTAWQQGLKKGYEAYALDMEHLMNYFIYSYVLGALYDHDVYSKIKLAVFNCLIIRELEIGVWVETGRFRREDAVAITHRFAKELEHSDYNIEKLEHFLSGHRAVSLEQLLICI